MMMMMMSYVVLARYNVWSETRAKYTVIALKSQQISVPGTYEDILMFCCPNPKIRLSVVSCGL